MSDQVLTYSLSNRQRKELLVRGQSLRIAIPVGPDDVDPVQFARASLPEDHEWVTDAEIDEIMVSRSGATGLNGLIGQILDMEYEAALQIKRIPLFCNVVIATLTPPRLRGKVASIQWPGAAFIEGEQLGKTSQESGQSDSE